jgi:hypothetical protein
MNTELKTQILGVSGSALLVLSAFLPTAVTGLGVTSTLFQNGGWLGVALLLVSVLSFVLAIVDKYWWSVAITSITAIASSSRVFLAVMSTDIRPDWGLGVLALGTVMVCLSVILGWQRLGAKRLVLLGAPMALAVLVAMNSSYIGQIRVYGTVTLRQVLSVLWGSL